MMTQAHSHKLFPSTLIDDIYIVIEQIENGQADVDAIGDCLLDAQENLEDLFEDFEAPCPKGGEHLQFLLQAVIETHHTALDVVAEMLCEETSFWRSAAKRAAQEARDALAALQEGLTSSASLDLVLC